MTLPEHVALPEPETLAELVGAVARLDPERIALIFDDRSYSYSELEARIEPAARALAARGVRRGDRVAVMLQNSLEFIEAFYGTLRLGAIVVPVNAMYKHHEVEHILRDSEPRAAVIDAALWPQAAEAFAAVPVETVALAGEPTQPTQPTQRTQPAQTAQTAQTASGTVAWHELTRDAPPRAGFTPEPSDAAVIIYTSGTTGKPKGAVHSHHTLLMNCRQSSAMLRRKFTAADRALTPLPLAHLYAMQSGLNGMFRVGGSLVLMRRFDAAGVLANVERYRVTFLTGAPPMFIRWMAMPELRSFDLTSLRIVTCGAAPLAATVLREFEDATGVRISESYGLTEAGPTTHSNSNGAVDKIGSVGPPAPLVESRLVGPDGRDVAPGEPGEIAVRSPSLMLGYWRNPQATADTIRDGWLFTGDVATVDADGYYTIVDRLKDMISAGGYKIWPREIEDMLATHPAVSEVAVVGMPDDDLGERPAAFVVARPGATVSAADLLAFASANLAAYKRPAHIEIVDSLPRLTTGKVLRRDLRERAKLLAAR
jgi:long-chain acyl-CoA synthetase